MEQGNQNETVSPVEDQGGDRPEPKEDPRMVTNFDTTEAAALPAQAAGFPLGFTEQLQRQAKAIAAGLIDRLPGLQLTPDQALDVQYATFQSLRATYMASVAQQEEEKQEAEILIKEARSILANVTAVKAKDAETVLAQAIIDTFNAGTAFLLKFVAAS